MHSPQHVSPAWREGAWGWRAHVSLCLQSERAVKSAAQPAECKYTQCKTRYCGASMALKRFICLSAQTKLWCAHCVSLCASRPRQTQLYYAAYNIYDCCFARAAQKMPKLCCMWTKVVFYLELRKIFPCKLYMLNFPCLHTSLRQKTIMRAPSYMDLKSIPLLQRIGTSKSKYIIIYSDTI